MLVVGLVVMEQNLVLYVTILVIGAVYGVNMIFTFPKSFSHPLLIKRRGEDLGL